MHKGKRVFTPIFALALALLLLLTACGAPAPAATPVPSGPAATATPKPAASSSPTPASTPTPAAPEPAAQVSTVLDQYYANDMFMIEMLINDDVIVSEQASSLMLTTPEQHAAIVVSIIPGIQNLAAAGELTKSVVASTYEGAAAGEVEDGFLFGARAKLIEYVVADDEAPFMGIHAASIVNQSCYFMNAMFYEGISEAEGKLMIDVFSSINVLTPIDVDQAAQTATYVSQYEEELKTEAVKPSKSTKSQSVDYWTYLPYDFYSWWGDPGDYYDGFPSDYFEPDYDYYSDPGDYWSWGWDDDSWGFYDEYDSYYDWDTYQEYEDYYDDADGGGGYGDDYAEYYDWALEANDYDWSEDDYDDYEVYSDPGDGYDEWSDPGDYYDDGYEVYSDPGDGYDEWSDPGDYYDDGYGDYSDW